MSTKKRNEGFERKSKELKESFRRRGWSIKNTEIPRSIVPTSLKKPQTKKNNSIIPPPIKETPRFSQTRTIPCLLQKLRSVYDSIENKALYLSPVLDITFPGGRKLNIDESGNQKICVGEESYNSVLLYTILTTVLNDGKMLVYGPPGSGKTSSSRFVGSAIHNLLVDYIKYSTIYGHPEQTEEKMVAMFDPIKMIKGERKLIVREFLKTPIKVIDEVNRLRPESLSILYELLNTGSVIYQGQLIRSVQGPLFATANTSDSGNYDIPPPFKDRFDIAVIVDSINPYYLEVYTKKRIGSINNLENKLNLNNNLTKEDLTNIRKEIYSVDFPTEVMGRVAHFIAELTGCDMAGVAIERKTKGNLSERKPPSLCQDCDHYNQDKSICSKTENGLSARALRSIYTYSKALAYWRGKNQVGEEDVKRIIPHTTWFRINPTRSAFDKNPKFINDRISLVEELYKTSSKSYDEIIGIMPDYKEITSLVFSNTSSWNSANRIQNLDGEEIENLIVTAGKLDTPAKYPLIIALKKIYNENVRRR